MASLAVLDFNNLHYYLKSNTEHRLYTQLNEDLDGPLSFNCECNVFFFLILYHPTLKNMTNLHSLYLRSMQISVDSLRLEKVIRQNNRRSCFRFCSIKTKLFLTFKKKQQTF